jgi:MYXO-CTERM domain-containing protein
MTRTSAQIVSRVALFLSALPLGCSTADEFEVNDAPVESSAALSSELPRVRGITLEVPIEHTLASGGVETLVGRRTGPITFAGPGEPPLPIYLNRNGGTYSPGNDDSRQNTSIVPNRRSTVDAYAGTNAQWNEIVTCLIDMFAAYNVVMVETEPGAGEYIESVIGGSPQQVGLPSGVGGVAPIDSFQCNIIPNAIVFTFSAVVGNDPRTSCEIAAQEIAHAISLDHEYHCPDPMTYLGGCGDKSFRDFDAQCGEYQPRACNCNRQLHNSVEILTEKLGLNTGLPPVMPPNDPIPPVVQITSPADNANLPQDSTITVTADASDDMTLSATELIWEFSNSVFGCPYNGNAGAVTCTRSGNTSTWNIRVGQGDRRFSVRARDAANNVTTTPVRTIHLGTSTPPPMDQNPPVVGVTSPADGETLTANATIRVVATATDDQGLAGVELVWGASTTSNFPCPFNGTGVSCTTSGGTYTWDLAVGVGTRRFSISAVDLAGNRAETQQRQIFLSTETGMPPTGADTVAEPNNTAGEAFPARCGNAIDLVVTAGNEDWFTFDAPANTSVQVVVGAAAGTVIGVELYTADGATTLASTADVLGQGGSVTGLSQGPVILSKITTNGAATTYRLTALCINTEPPVNPPTDDGLEENDAPANASRVNCDDVRTGLTAADPDYFVVNVPEGRTLTVAIAGVGTQSTMLDGNGVVVEQPAQAAAGDLWIRVEPTAGSTTYDARFDCNPRGENPLAPNGVSSGDLGGGCACNAEGGSPAGLLPLALVGLFVALRRRR